MIFKKFKDINDLLKFAAKFDPESYGTEYNQEFMENFKIENIDVELHINPADRSVGIFNESIDDLTAIIACASQMSIESATQLLFEQESFNNYLNKVALPDLFKGAFDTIGIDIYKKAISKYDFLSNALMHQLESEISGRLDDMKAEIVEDESKEIDGIIYLKILFYI